MSLASITSRSLGRKRFLSKLLLKKSKEPSSPTSSRLSSSAEPSFTENALDATKLLKRSLVVSSTPRSVDSPGTLIDDSSIFNHELADDTHDLLLLTTSDVFSNLLNEDEKDYVHNDTVEFPAVGDDEEDQPWAGLTYEALVFPKFVKLSKRSNKSPRMTNNLFLAQELHCGTEERDDVSVESDHASVSDDSSSTMNKDELLVMEFSRDGKYLAVAGRDCRITVWQVISSPLSRLQYKNYEATRHQEGAKQKRKQYTSAPVFHQEPVRVFEGHSRTVLSLDWSKNNFLISGSMDRTVKLWNVERPDCLETFTHFDFVTCVKFHPTDDRFFVSGSLDNHVRLWSILENSVAYSRDLGDDVLITTLAMTPAGNYTIVGGFNGSLFALETQGLHFMHRIEIKGRSFGNPFHNKNGKKITGINIYENEASTDLPTSSLAKWNMLITTNDSSIRLIDLRQRKLVTRFKGATNNSSSIVASLSDDNRFIVSGSEDHWCYIWENNNSIINNKLRIALKDLYVEGKHQVSDKQKKVTKLLHDNKIWKKLSLQRFLEDGNGQHYIANENNSYSSFHAHHARVNAAIFAPESTKKLLEFSDDIIFDLVKRGPMLDKIGVSPTRRKDVTFAKSTGLNCGHIIVTCDQAGLIRVFRQDSAYYVRKALIDLKKSSKCLRKDCHISTVSEVTNRSLTKLDLPALNVKLMNSRSLSPSFDYAPNIRAKFLKLKPSSTRTALSPVTSGVSNPERPRSQSMRGFTTLAGTLSSSSQISLTNLNNYTRARDLSTNYVNVSIGRDHDSKSESDEDLSPLRAATPKSVADIPISKGRPRRSSSLSVSDAHHVQSVTGAVPATTT